MNFISLKFSMLSLQFLHQHVVNSPNILMKSSLILKKLKYFLILSKLSAILCARIDLCWHMKNSDGI
jgi:hypothetical protein